VATADVGDAAAALERLEGIDEGHMALLDWIEQWLESLEERSTG
jgi:hypothetical protein